MPIGLKGNNDGSGAIQIGGSDAISISTGLNTTFAGTVTAPTGTLYPIVTGTVNAGGTTPFPSSGGPASVDFTGIPSWAKRVTVMFSGVSLSATAVPLFQLGAGSATTTGYTATSSRLQDSTAVSVFASTAGFPINSALAASIISGSIVFTNITGNTWIGQGVFSNTTTTNYVYTTAGQISLSGTLDRVRVTTTGTDLFDAGSINIMWE